ncbi:hypothetical protein HOG98_02180 [bacterium]|jgi:hypothetical protein|nr:hypothetical protein [bacterium]
MNWPELMQLVRSGESGDTRFLSRVKSVDDLGPVLTALASGTGGHVVVGIDINQLHFLGSDITLEWIQALIQDYCNPFFEIKVDKIQRDSKSVVCIQVFEGKLKPFFYKKKCFLFEDGLLKMAMHKFEPDHSLENTEQQTLTSGDTVTEPNIGASNALFSEEQLPTQKKERAILPQPNLQNHKQPVSDSSSEKTHNNISETDSNLTPVESTSVVTPNQSEYVDAREFSRKKATNVGESAWRSADLLEEASQPVISDSFNNELKNGKTAGDHQINRIETDPVVSESLIKKDIVTNIEEMSSDSINNANEIVKNIPSNTSDIVNENVEEDTDNSPQEKMSSISNSEPTPSSIKEKVQDSFVKINYKMAAPAKKKEPDSVSQSSLENKSGLESLFNKQTINETKNSPLSQHVIPAQEKPDNSVDSPKSGVSGFGVNQENTGFEDSLGLVTTEELSNSEDISEEGQFLEFENALNNRQSKAISFVLENGSIRNKEYRHLLSVSHKTAHIELVDLVSKSLLQSKGSGRSTCYVLQEKSRTIVEKFAMTLA